MQQISVVCVTYNNEATICDLMDSLVPQCGVIRELIVVDNGSTDGTVDAVRSRITCAPFDVSIHEGENIGFAAGIDACLHKLTSPEYPVLVVNPDVSVAAGIVEKMIGLMMSIPEVAIVTAPLELPSGGVDPASRRKLPQLASSAIYAAFGKFTPRSLAYNSLMDSEVRVDEPTGLAYSAVEATTGALMLVNPTFRGAGSGIFDQSYWMYGEDLQLCADAHREGRLVLMLEEPGCVHIKGTSSGLPRSRVADQAFHRALYMYYAKNLRRNGFEALVVAGAVGVRYLVSRAMASTLRDRESRGKSTAEETQQHE